MLWVINKSWFYDTNQVTSVYSIIISFRLIQSSNQSQTTCTNLCLIVSPSQIYVGKCTCSWETCAKVLAICAMFSTLCETFWSANHVARMQ